MKLRSRRQIEWIVGFTLALMCACLVTTPAHAQSERGLLWDYAAGDRVNTVDVSAVGERMAIGARDNVVSMLDADGALLWTFTADNSVLGLDLSPDGRWLAVASEDRQVYLLDGDGNRLWQFKAQRPMNNAAVADDGSLVAATSNDLSVYALDDAGELLWEEPLGIGVQAVAIYGKGDKARVIVGSDDGLVTIYSRDGNTLLREQLDYDVRSLDVTPSGGRILVGTSDGMASLLNGSNGDILWEFDTDTDSNDISVALAADGQTAAVGAQEMAYLLDGDGQQIQTFALGDDVLDVAITDDGASLAVGMLGARSGLYDREAAVAGSAKAAIRASLVDRRSTVGVGGRGRHHSLDRALDRHRQAHMAAGQPATAPDRTKHVAGTALLCADIADAVAAAHLQLLSGLFGALPRLHRLESGHQERVGRLRQLPVSAGRPLLSRRLPQRHHPDPGQHRQDHDRAAAGGRADLQPAQPVQPVSGRARSSSCPS